MVTDWNICESGGPTYSVHVSRAPSQSSHDWDKPERAPPRVAARRNVCQYVYTVRHAIITCSSYFVYSCIVKMIHKWVEDTNSLPPRNLLDGAVNCCLTHSSHVVHVFVLILWPEVSVTVTLWWRSCACNCSAFCKCIRSSSLHNVMHSSNITWSQSFGG